MSGKRTLSLSAYKKSKQALAVAPAKKERRLGFGESASTREVSASPSAEFSHAGRASRFSAGTLVGEESASSRSKHTFR